jgi:beta-phosphoglucomutase-like phosphatase (HAD superfamily)
MPPAAILDVDGTLLDTNYQHAIAWYRAFRRHEIVLPVWRIHRHIGMGGDQLVSALAGDQVEDEKGDDLRDAESELYAELIEEVEPLEGAADLIQAALEKAGAGAIAVFSSIEELRRSLDDTPLGGG